MMFIWIPLLPLLVFPFVLLWGKRLPGQGAWVSTAAIAGSFAISFQTFWSHATGHHEVWHQTWPWIKIAGLELPMGIYVDGLTATMLLVVTAVSLLVHVYSTGYMHDDPRYHRFFAFLSLFSASMLWLVLADNLLGLFIGWEMVGLCSYFLIGFWFEKPAAAAAGRKAFLTTKIGDVGFFTGIMLLFALAGTLEIQSLPGKLSGMDPGLITLAALLLFCGAVGKSAQAPLHVGLPDAMEGPTPVSALTHAATMVAAGVYLIARMYGVFFLSPDALQVVAWTGTITALFAASIALVTNDIKRILAYSTLSQLGFMVMSLGVGGYTAGMFHLTTHAFFKALLFLGAGSVIHAVHTQDIWHMGGLLKKMPVTGWTFFIASLAIAGIPPLSGFYSKDEILLAAFHYDKKIFVIGVVVACMTAFYMFRLWFTVFLGSPRKTADAHHHEPKESPWSMAGPLAVLAVPSIVAGFLLAKPFNAMVHWEGLHYEHNQLVVILSIAAGVGGMAVAWLGYVKGAFSPDAIMARFKPVHTLLFNKYYVDELYEKTVLALARLVSRASWRFDSKIVDGLLVNGSAKLANFISWLSEMFDRYGVDGVGVNGMAWITQRTAGVLRYSQTGFVQNYLLVIALGFGLLLMGRVFLPF